MFEQLSQWAQQSLSAGGSVALALLMLVENLFPPIPSEVVLPYAGFVVGRGELAFAQALIASTAGSVAGALALYAVGRYGGRPLVQRYHRVLRFSDADLDRADAWFDRYGPIIVLTARVVPIARSVVSLPAGWSEMPLGRFALLTTFGTMVWNTLLLGAGMALGENYEQVVRIVSAYGNLMLVVAVAALAFLAVWWVRRRT